MREIALLSLPVLIALICAGLMGYAVQRGATCMVVAVEEVVSSRRITRLVAMLEAGLWVAIGMLLANATGFLQMAPTSYPISMETIFGGAILGLGALVNRSCVVGTIAKLGSGKWAYAATPIGFYLGCLIAGPFVSHPHPTNHASALFRAGLVLVVPLTIYGLWRGRSAWGSLRDRTAFTKVWAPHQATIMIGIAFVIMLLTVGSWAYTQILVDAAAGKLSNIVLKLILFAGLLCGAIAGGWTADLIKPTLPKRADIARCLIGGGMMGVGSISIPGSNDSLILLSLPLLLPYAFVALTSMILAIFAGLIIERWFVASQHTPPHS